MAQENVEIVRQAVEAFNRRDFDGMFASVARPDFEYTASGLIPGEQGVYRGLREFSRLSERVFGEFDDLHAEIDDLIDAGDRVLLGLTTRGRGRKSGAETSWRYYQVWTIRDGRVLRGQGFLDRDEALQAAGLRE